MKILGIADGMTGGAAIIEDGKIIPHGPMLKGRTPHAEMPGAAATATEINHPGPVEL